MIFLDLAGVGLGLLVVFLVGAGAVKLADKWQIVETVKKWFDPRK